MPENDIQKFFIGEFYNGNFHGKGLLLTVSNFSWVFDSEDFYGFSLTELKYRAMTKKEEHTASSDLAPEPHVYFNIFEGEWRDGDIVSGKVECFKNIDKSELFEKHGFNRAIAETCGLVEPDLVYKGRFKHFKPHENESEAATMEWKDKSNYTGTFVNGKRSGRGTFISMLTHECYEGEFKNNQRNGEGYCMYSDGS
jgi:hypothetical protein